MRSREGDDQQLKKEIRREIAEILAESRPHASPPASCCPMTEITIRVGQADEIRTLQSGAPGAKLCCCCVISFTSETAHLFQKAAEATGTTVEHLVEQK